MKTKLLKSTLMLTATMFVIASCGSKSDTKTETGFDVIDINKDKYSVDSIFDNVNGLVVYSTYSDGSKTTAKRSDYTYSVTLGNEVIDTSKAFGKSGTFTCTVNYKQFEPKTYQFTIAKSIKNIEIHAQPAKVEFNVGETFSSNGLTLKVNYNDSSSELVTTGFTTNYDGHSFAANETGLTLVVVTYQNFTAQYPINVKAEEAYATKLEIVTKANKTSFFVGELFSASGLILKVTYSDNSTKTISSGFTTNFDGYVFKEADISESTSVVVLYEGVITSYNISIAKQTKTVSKIEISHPTSSLTFYVGDTFNTLGLALKVTYSDLTEETISSGFTTNFDGYTFKDVDVGENKIVTVTYLGSSTTYYITVVAAEKAISKIEIQTPASKTTFDIGDMFSSKGLTLKVTYKDDTSEVVSSGFTTSLDGHTFEDKDVGTNTVTVTYRTFEVTYSVTVKNAIKGTYSYEFTEQQYESNSTKKLNGVDWTVNSNSKEFAFDDQLGRGQQFGTKKNPASKVTLSTSGFEYNISKVTIESCGQSGNDGLYLSVSVGGQQIGSTQTLSTTSTAYDFAATNPVSGELVITWSQPKDYPKAIWLKSIVVEYDAAPVPATGIAVQPASGEIGLGKKKQLTVEYTPANATTDKEVTWKSSDNNIATVDDNGLVTVASGAKVGDTVDITATLTANQTTSTCKLSVIEQKQDAYTVMIYMSGNDLESASSGGGCATSDITEILTATGQPDNVNIIIQTGGAKSWKSTYGISSNELGRYHVKNNKLVKDSALTKASMGESSTFQSFIEWGINEYPADKMGVVLWNHGGAMQGVCCDENFESPYIDDFEDSLLADEFNQAMSNALKILAMLVNLNGLVMMLV